ncbi:hypothetical protein ACFX2C_005015 [Malus domestica]
MAHDYNLTIMISRRRHFGEMLRMRSMGLVDDLMKGSDNPNLINSTHVVLISKVPNSDSVFQFRPISLCNYSYKILSKVMANHIRPLLQELISPSQNVFIVGRQIQDNIGIAHKLFHFLKTQRTRRKFELGVKLYMHKVYDRVE